MSLRDEYNKRVSEKTDKESRDRQEKAYYGRLDRTFVSKPLWETVTDSVNICRGRAEDCSDRLRRVFAEAVSIVRPDLWYAAALDFEPGALTLVRDPKIGNRAHLAYSTRYKYVQIRRHDGKPGMFDAGVYIAGEPYNIKLFGSDMPKKETDKIRTEIEEHGRSVRELMTGSQRYVAFLMEGNGDSRLHGLFLFEDGNAYQPWDERPGYLPKRLYDDTERFMADLLADLNRKK